MSYSITPIIQPHEDKHGLHKILIQVIYRRMKVYYPTDLKTQASNWKGGRVVKAANAEGINHILQTKKNEIEKRLLEAIRLNEEITKPQLTEIVKNKRESVEYFHDFIDSLAHELQGKFSVVRLRHYSTMAAKVKPFGSKLSAITIKWLQDFEAHLRKPGSDGKRLDGNTIKSNMAILKACLNKAVDKGLIEKKQFEKYKVPSYVQKLADYLTQDEIEKFYTVTEAAQNPLHKLAGYYFLLSCYAGYRLGDLKKFDYEKSVRDGKIILTAAKNKSIISIPIHSRLKKVLEYIKDKPLGMAEQTARKYIKDIAKIAGISRNVKPHSGRHSFAMMLMEKQFTVDEVAEFIGDTRLITKVYAKIHKPDLDQKIKERLG